jgi:nucleoside-diphosphate-sugar epimerase
VAPQVPGGERDLTVAVTGPTGTFGFGLMPLLQADDRVARVVGVARRRFDPDAYGWTKMEYRRGDVRDPDVMRDVFSHADVVVHLAFLVTGAASREVIRSINVDGTLNAFGAAAAAGVRRFVYSSSVAAYGLHRDNPIGMTEIGPCGALRGCSTPRRKPGSSRCCRSRRPVRSARPVSAAPVDRAGPARCRREGPAARAAGTAAAEIVIDLKVRAG